MASGSLQIKIEFNEHSNTYTLNLTAATYLGAAALDSPDIPLWFLVFLQHYDLALVGQAVCHLAIQLPAALVGKSPSRGH